MSRLNAAPPFRVEGMMLRTLPGRLLRGFLALPLLIVAGFVLLAYGVDWLDNHSGPQRFWNPLRQWLAQYVGDTQSAIGTLSAIAGSLITVTSITFSILLLAVQQGAAVLNAQVVDHYVARASNRAWLGFFVGVSVFVLVTLVQTTHTQSPVFGVIVSALLGAGSLLALVVLIRSTIDQTRPTIVIGAIHAAALGARQRQAAWLAITAEPDGTPPPGSAVVPAARAGRLQPPDPTILGRLLDATPGLRLTFVASVGDYLAHGAPVAVLDGPGDVGLVERVAALLPIESVRDVSTDAGASLDHLATIGWTAICTAKSDPDVGAEVLNALHDLVRHWAPAVQRAAPGAPIRYRDAVPGQMVGALESAIVAAAESHQHQSLSRTLDAISETVPLWSETLRARIPGLIDLIGRTLADHQPTALLRAAVGRLVGTLEEVDGQQAVARSLRAAEKAAWM